MELLGRESDLLVLVILIGIISLSTLTFAVSAVSTRLHRDRVRSRRNELESIWEPLLLDALTEEIPLREVWDRVPRGRELWLVEYLLRVTRRLRGDDVDALARVAEPYLDLVSSRLNHRLVEQRAFAVETLNVLGCGRYTAEIAAALDDRAPLVAMIAARALTRSGESDHLEAILDRLHRFDTWSPRLLMSLLASIGPAAAPVLRKALVDPDRPLLVRVVSTSALQQLNDLKAADCAVQVLRTETDREVLASSLRLLAKVGRPEQAEFARALCGSSDFVVRAHALTALARLGEPEDAGILIEAIDDESSWVALHAVNGLKLAGHLSQLRELADSEHPRSELARQVLSEAA